MITTRISCRAVCNALTIAVASVFSFVAFANDVAIIGATVYNGSDDAPVAATVLITGGRITSIAPDIEIPDGYSVIETQGGSITPGLFNAATTLGIEEIELIAETVDTFTTNPRITASLRVADAYNFRSPAISLNRAQGVTHALTLPVSGSSLIAGQAALVDLSGASRSVIDPFAALVVNLGEQGQLLAGGSRAAAMQQLREAFEDARDFIEHQSEFNRRQRRDYALSRADLAALAQVITDQKPLIVNVSRAADILAVIAFAQSESLNLVLWNAEEAWVVADAIAAAKVPVMIDPIRNLPTRYETLAARADNALLLEQAGVRLIFTGKDGSRTHRAYLMRQSAGNAVGEGFSKSAAIEAMTSLPAMLFADGRFSNRIEVGATANLVVWSGDPLELTSEPLAVIINGENTSLTSRSDLLAERYLERIRASAGN